jgi:hypothetical protein
MRRPARIAAENRNARLVCQFDSEKFEFDAV